MIKSCEWIGLEISESTSSMSTRRKMKAPGSLARTHRTVDQSNRRDTGKSPEWIRWEKSPELRTLEGFLIVELPPVGLGRGSRSTQTGCWGSWVGKGKLHTLLLDLWLGSVGLNTFHDWGHKNYDALMRKKKKITIIIKVILIIVSKIITVVIMITCTSLLGILPVLVYKFPHPLRSQVHKSISLRLGWFTGYFYDNNNGFGKTPPPCWKNPK